MKLKKTLRLYSYFIQSFVLILLAGCTNVKLVGLPPTPVYTQSINNFCLKPPTGKKRYNNVLFVIDRSGSNDSHSRSGTPDPGNDPSKNLRGTAIEEFYNKHKDDPFYRWGFIFYSGANISSYINNGDPRIPTFEDSATMLNAINEFYQDSDVAGNFGTDYTAALSLVETAVRNDIRIRKDNVEQEDEENVYTIFFASDGFPEENLERKPITDQNDPRIEKIREIVSLPAHYISLNTVFYARPDYPLDRGIAIRGLELMSQAGRGTFSDIRDTEVIKFEEVVVGEKPESWRIKRMRLVVFNLNSAACEDGSIDADSDADGICDKDELSYNDRPYYKQTLQGKQFDPQNRNSIVARYNDSFYWKFSLLPTGTGLGQCSSSLFLEDSDFDFLNSCEEAMISDNNANGPYEGWDIPGNNANKNNPDSDGDAFLDWIEFSWFRLDSAFSTPVNFTNIFDYYAPNVNAEKLMYEHRHIMDPDTFSRSNYDTELRFTEINQNGESCYTFNQTQLETYNTLAIEDKSQVSGYEKLVHKAGENKILVYFIATPEKSPNATGVLFHTIKTLKYGERLNSFSLSGGLSEFDTYFIPESD